MSAQNWDKFLAKRRNDKAKAFFYKKRPWLVKPKDDLRRLLPTDLQDLPWTTDPVELAMVARRQKEREEHRKGIIEGKVLLAKENARLAREEKLKKARLAKAAIAKQNWLRQDVQNDRDNMYLRRDAMRRNPVYAAQVKIKLTEFSRTGLEPTKNFVHSTQWEKGSYIVFPKDCKKIQDERFDAYYDFLHGKLSERNFRPLMNKLNGDLITCLELKDNRGYDKFIDKLLLQTQ